MTSSRRQFLAAGTTAIAASFVSEADAGAPPRTGPGQVANVPFRLGIVTYNIAATWDLPTIFRICRAVGLSPVELRRSLLRGIIPG